MTDEIVEGFIKRAEALADKRFEKIDEKLKLLNPMIEELRKQRENEQ